MERIWIYQSNLELTAQEIKQSIEKLSGFTEQWKAHGKQLAAHAEVRYNRFIILFLDEEVAAATGCSIDKSVRLLKELQSELNIELFDRMLIAYRQAGIIKVASRSVFENLIEKGEVNENTIVFDNTVSNSEERASRWEVPMKESWHAKVFRLPA